MSKIIFSLVLCMLTQVAFAKETIKALYIPLADHYPAIVAYDKYRGQMKEADFVLTQEISWPSLRADFEEGKADIAFIISPMSMDMFAKNPAFKWISLVHRNGDALAVNEHMEKYFDLMPHRKDRKPVQEIAEAFSKAKQATGSPIQVGVPSTLATHTVILYKFLKDHGKTLSIQYGGNTDAIAVPIAPSTAPIFLKLEDKRTVPATFEQSLPWADVVETGGYGKVAWYSKDVLQWPHGHVECIVIATDKAIREKTAALKEVIYFLHKAGLDIDQAQQAGKEDLLKIATMIRKHIPVHSEEAIVQSLDKELDAISYTNLNIDKGGLKQVMDLAVESGILRHAIDIDTFADDRFSTEITIQ